MNYNALTNYQLSQITTLSQVDVGTTGNLLIGTGTPATAYGNIGDYFVDVSTEIGGDRKLLVEAGEKIPVYSL